MRLYFGLDGKAGFARLETMKNQYVLDTFYLPMNRKWHGHFKGIFLDSGAFSAWQKNETIDRAAYADYEQASTGLSVTDWLYKCFWRICDDDGYPKIKVHGFRFTARMAAFPFWSVDSTSWAQSENGTSMTKLGRDMPWLQPLEIGDLVVKYYSRLPRCTRLTEPKQIQLF